MVRLKMANKSEADDIEFMSRIVQQSEKYICLELSKLRQDFKSSTEELKLYEARMMEQDLRIEKLENENFMKDKRINAIEKEKETIMEQVTSLQTKLISYNSECNWKESMQRAFASALDSLRPDTNVTILSQEHPSMQDPASFLQLTSTPNQEPDQNKDIFNACKVNLSRENWAQESRETSQLITELDTLPEDTRTKLKPYCSTNKASTREKLNMIQRAFLIYKVHELKNTNQKLTDTFIQAVIMEGIKERLWAEDFKPSNELTLQQYIFNRLKNERKNLANEDMLKNTNSRLASFLSNSYDWMAEEGRKERDNIQLLLAPSLA